MLWYHYSSATNRTYWTKDWIPLPTPKGDFSTTWSTSQNWIFNLWWDRRTAAWKHFALNLPGSILYYHHWRSDRPTLCHCIADWPVNFGITNVICNYFFFISFQPFRIFPVISGTINPKVHYQTSWEHLVSSCFSYAALKFYCIGFQCRLRIYLNFTQNLDWSK